MGLSKSTYLNVHAIINAIVTEIADIYINPIVPMLVWLKRVSAVSHDEVCEIRYAV